MSVAITGASGQLGRLVADQLLAATDPAQVVLLTRDPARLSEYAERGADVRAVDFLDEGTFPTAFDGVEKLLLISSDTVGARLDSQKAAIAGAVAAGVKHIAYTSVPQPVEANPALVVADHAGTEEALKASGVAWTMLRNNLYADMQVQAAQQAIASGKLFTSAGEGASAYVTRADCAAAAVGVLLGSGHENVAYDITGPQALTPADVAALVTEVSGTPVEVVQVDDAGLTAGLESAGLPPFVAELLVSFEAAARGGYLADVTGAVEELSGRAPQGLREVLAAGLAG